MLKYRDGSRIEQYQTSFVGEFALGAAETAGSAAQHTEPALSTCRVAAQAQAPASRLRRKAARASLVPTWKLNSRDANSGNTANTSILQNASPPKALFFMFGFVCNADVLQPILLICAAFCEIGRIF